MDETKIGGYPKHTPEGLALTDWQGKKVLGYGHVVACRKMRPGERGSWISNERCSYRFKIDGKWYAGRGYGDGVAVLLRLMKRPPRR